METICALSSGPPPSGVAVIRISGPETAAALDAVAGGPPAPRRAVLRKINDPATGEVIDEAVVIWMPGLRNFIPNWTHSGKKKISTG